MIKKQAASTPTPNKLRSSLLGRWENKDKQVIRMKDPSWCADWRSHYLAVFTAPWCEYPESIQEEALLRQVSHIFLLGVKSAVFVKSPVHLRHLLDLPCSTKLGLTPGQWALRNSEIEILKETQSLYLPLSSLQIAQQGQQDSLEGDDTCHQTWWYVSSIGFPQTVL